MDEDAAWTEQPTTLLSPDLTPHPLCLDRPVPGSELWRAEETTVLDRIERCRGEHVQGSGHTEVQWVVFEGLTGQVSQVDPDRLRAELQQRT